MNYSQIQKRRKNKSMNERMLNLIILGLNVGLCVFFFIDEYTFNKRKKDIIKMIEDYIKQ